MAVCAKAHHTQYSLLIAEHRHRIPQRGRDLSVNKKLFQAFCAAGKAQSVPFLPVTQLQHALWPDRKGLGSLLQGYCLLHGHPHSQFLQVGISVQDFPCQRLLLFQPDQAVILPCNGYTAGKIHGRRRVPVEHQLLGL